MKRPGKEYTPCDEEHLALMAVVNADEVKVKDRIAAVVVRQGGGKAVVAFPGPAHLVHQHFSGLLVDLVHHVPAHLLPLHLCEGTQALLFHSHPLCGLPYPMP